MSLPISTERLELLQFELSLELWDHLEKPQRSVAEAVPDSIPFFSGKRVLDIGCGVGLFSVIALSRGCAVVATDVVADALVATRTNAARNNLPLERLQTRLGSLFEPVLPGETFDVIVTNLPQTPCPAELNMSPSFRDSKWGGEDGLQLLMPALEQAFKFLEPGGGVYQLQIGWLDWRQLDACVRSIGAQTNIIGGGVRPFLWEEYERYAPGLKTYYENRIAKGEAQPVVVSGEGLGFPFRFVYIAR